MPIDLSGISVNYNGGIGPIDIAHGGNTTGSGRVGQSTNSTYQSITTGLSGGLPFGVSRTVEHTRIFRIFKN